MSELLPLEEISIFAALLSFLIDDGCHRLGLLSIWLWRSEILKSDCTIDATSKGGVKLCLVERRVSMVEGVCFCMMMGFGTLWLFRSA